jgi:hypothetical protein
MGRRPSGKVVLAGIGALAAAAFAAVAIALALGGSGDPSPDPAASRETSPDATPTAPSAPTDRVGAEPQPSAPDAEAPAEGPTETTPPAEAAPDPGEPAGTARKTRFPEERVKDPDKRGRSFTVPPAQRFSGTGNALIGTVDVRRPSIVKWTTRGSIEVQFGREAFPIIAPQASGRLIVPPYRLEMVRVIADASWTITIRPQRGG